MSTDLERYCFDTNCFIEPWNKFYSYKSHQSYWDDFILPNILSGNIFTLEEVFLEIKKKDDDLLAWFKRNKLDIGEVLVETSVDLTSRVRELLTIYPKLSDNTRGRSIADPFLIEHAKKSGSSVVTLEGFSKKGLDRPKIPDVCKAENVPCITLYQYVDTMDVSFKLQQ